MKYSQNNEEHYILEYFKDQTGVFVDIGAYDVFRFSNTRALYERGWMGVLVEPAPKNYKAIDEHYKDDNRIAVLNIAVGDPEGKITFYESNGDAVGTTDREHMEKWGAAGVEYSEIEVEQMGVENFFNQYGGLTDFLSIDTESTNIQLFRAIPDWVFDRVKMICIEHDGNYGEIQMKLQGFGMKMIHLNAENVILVK